MQDETPNHYATLGLHFDCTLDDIRKAYRILAKAHHPDVNQNDPEASSKTHAITEAYKVLGNAESRKVYDAELEKEQQTADVSFGKSRMVDIKEDVFLNLREFITGTTREISVNDPANPNGSETYELIVPPETTTGKQFRINREAPFERGYIIARVKPWPDARFKARGADLKCDLNIYHQLAESGGAATITGVTGVNFEIDIPANCPRGEIIIVEGEGMPCSRRGRGNLLVRVMYRPEVRTRKSSARGSAHQRRRLR